MSSSKWEPIVSAAETPLVFIPLRGEDPALEREGFVALKGDCTDSSQSDPKMSEALTPSVRERAECLLREARKRAEQIEREAFEKGFAQGERAGRETAERSLAATLKSLKGAITAFQKAREERTQQMEKEVVRLAIGVARKILQQEVHANPKVVLAVVRAALKKVNLHEEIIVRVNPMDRDTLEGACPMVLQGLEGVRSLRIEPDERVERGGATVECAMGELDLRLERQLQQIERTFEKLLNEGSE